MSGHVDIVAFEVVCGWFVSPAPLFTTFLAVWLSGNALALINVVALRQTQLVLGWVTICGRVNHFGI